MSYNTFKAHGGQTYTGMKVGGQHRWNYSDSVWRELFPGNNDGRTAAIAYASTKTRVGKAPDLSGAVTDTVYHWWIVADIEFQLLENEAALMASVQGDKFKVGHKRPDWDEFNYERQGKAAVQFKHKYLNKLLAELGLASPPMKARKRKREEASEEEAEEPKPKRVKGNLSREAMFAREGYDSAFDMVFWTNDDLKAACQDRGLPASGVKDVLIQRLVNSGPVPHRERKRKDKTESAPTEDTEEEADDEAEDASEKEPPPANAAATTAPASATATSDAEILALPPRAQPFQASGKGPEQLLASKAVHQSFAPGAETLWATTDGRWVETKMDPDRWHMAFKAKWALPEGTASEVAELYAGQRMLLIADQMATKLDANRYRTAMNGTRYLLGSHDRAVAEKNRILLQLFEELTQEVGVGKAQRKAAGKAKAAQTRKQKADKASASSASPATSPLLAVKVKQEPKTRAEPKIEPGRNAKAEPPEIVRDQKTTVPWRGANFPAIKQEPAATETNDLQALSALARSATEAVDMDVDESTAHPSPDVVPIATSAGAASSVPPRPICRYGKACYRKNELHFREFAHPEGSLSRAPDAPPEGRNAPLSSVEVLAEDSAAHPKALEPSATKNAAIPVLAIAGA